MNFVTQCNVWLTTPIAIHTTDEKNNLNKIIIKGLFYKPLMFILKIFFYEIFRATIHNLS